MAEADNHAAVIWAMSKLEEAKKCEGGIHPKTKLWAWWWPLPPNDDGVIPGPVY